MGPPGPARPWESLPPCKPGDPISELHEATQTQSSALKRLLDSLHWHWSRLSIKITVSMLQGVTNLISLDQQSLPGHFEDPDTLVSCPKCVKQDRPFLFLECSFPKYGHICPFFYSPVCSTASETNHSSPFCGAWAPLHVIMYWPDKSLLFS